MNEIPAVTVMCWKDGEEIERELDYVEEVSLKDKLLGRPGYPMPKLLPGEEVRFTADGQIHIYELGRTK